MTKILCHHDPTTASDSKPTSWVTSRDTTSSRRVGSTAGMATSAMPVVANRGPRVLLVTRRAPREGRVVIILASSAALSS